MSDNQIVQPQEIRASLDRYGVRRIAAVIAYMGLTGVILFGAAGRFDWLGAWLYLALWVVIMAMNAVVLAKRSLEIINRRGRRGENTKPWDKVFAALYTPLGFIVLVVAGLDFRNGWSAMPVAWTGAGSAIFFVASVIVLWAMVTNTHFETTVRIQIDRGHRVVSDGPYRHVRHPGYVGMILFNLAHPLILGSWWALIPGGLALALLVIRTALEDRTLHAELPGYAEYAARTRYRLLPGVW